MYLGYISTRLQKLSEQRHIKYRVAGPASNESIALAEQRFKVSFPEQVRVFYQNYNGLRVEEPQLEIYPLEGLDLISPERLHFTTLNTNERLLFDVSHINEAGQWDIVTEDNYRVTLTMASFWTNKIWAWIEKRCEIWHK
jgi:cell wall assembly regulator SMI1